MGPVAEALSTASSLPDNRSDAFNHQTAFSEAIQSVQWVFVTPGPMPFVSSCLESADFYLNKVLKDAKELDNKQDHRDFVKLIKQMLNELCAYIKQFHTTGLAWAATVCTHSMLSYVCREFH